MPDDDVFTAKLNALADAISKKHDCDVLVYSGDLISGKDDRVIHLCRIHECRPNVLLMLSTFGGDVRVAYRIARYLQSNYKRLTVFVYGFCKSAGTLLAVGAHELVLSDYAELGPLDVQVRKTDEAGERSSGLTPMQALDTLQEESFDLFQEHFQRLRGDLEMTTKLAAEVASKLTVGLLGNVYSHIDPLRLGELSREIRIALDYGQRLIGNDGKRRRALARLVSGYPTHSFAIDRLEATQLFDGVREPQPEEEALAEHIRGVARYPADETIIEFVGTERAKPASTGTTTHERGSQETGTGAAKAGVPEDGRNLGEGEPSGQGEPGTPEKTSDPGPGPAN